MIGAESGIAIRKKIWISLAPSTFDDSASSLGTVCLKKARPTRIDHAPAAFGTTTAHMVSSIPRSLTTRYVWTIQPEYSMEKSMYQVTAVRPAMYWRERA